MESKCLVLGCSNKAGEDSQYCNIAIHQKFHSQVALKKQSRKAHDYKRRCSIRDLREYIKELESKLENIQAEHDALKDAYEAQVNRCSELETENDNLKQEIDIWLQKISNLEK